MYLILLVLISTPLFIYLINFTGSSIIKRTSSTLETGDASGRLQLWDEAFREFLANPLIGGRIEVSGIYPHNIFLEIAMATGIIGLFLFLIILLKSIKSGREKIKISPMFMIPFLIFICGLAQHFFSGALWGAIMLFSGLGLLNSKFSYD